MRTYQKLTLIGIIFGIIIAFGILTTLPSLDIHLVVVSILMMLGGLLFIFTLLDHSKVVGVYLLMLSGVVLLAMNLFGILPFALFLSAGIVAVRFKLQNEIEAQKLQKKDKTNRINIEVEFPKITYYNIGLSAMDSLARAKIVILFEKVSMFSMPIITGLALFLIIGATVILLSNSTVRDASESIGPEANQIDPSNPYIPWDNPLSIGAIAFLSSIFISQLGRGIIARKYGIKIESWGVDTILGIIPTNLFLKLDKEEFTRLPLKRKSAILTVDPLSNIILAGISLTFVLIITSTLIVTAPSDPKLYGLVITDVHPESLAESVGLANGDIIQQIQSKVIRNTSDLNKYLNINLGKLITIDIIDNDTQSQKIKVTLPSEREPGKGILGISITPVADPKKVLDRYNSMIVTSPLGLLAPPTFVKGMVPFSDLNAPKYTSPIFGEHFAVFANFFFWIWFINFNIGLFESLPINHLPGGRLYNSLIEHKLRNKPHWISKCLTIILSLIMIALAFYSLWIPWLF